MHATCQMTFRERTSARARVHRDHHRVASRRRRRRAGGGRTEKTVRRSTFDAITSELEHLCASVSASRVASEIAISAKRVNSPFRTDPISFNCRRRSRRDYGKLRETVCVTILILALVDLSWKQCSHVALPDKMQIYILIGNVAKDKLLPLPLRTFTIENRVFP